MNSPIPDDGQGVFTVCLVLLFSGVAIWLLVSAVVSWMTRQGEERIRRMERMEQKLSARIK